MQPDRFLEQGAKILAPKLEPLGYRFEVIQRPLQGSGGTFAVAGFRRGERLIRIWARFDNIRVNYVVGDVEFTHTDHMRALGLERSAQFPGFNDGDPFSAFERLLHDLDFCGEFLTGDAEQIVERVRSLPPEKSGFGALGS